LVSEPRFGQNRTVLANRPHPALFFIDLSGDVSDRGADQLFELLDEPRHWNLMLDEDASLGEGWTVVIDRLDQWAKANRGKVYVHVKTLDQAQAVRSLGIRWREDLHLWVEFIIPGEVEAQLPPPDFDP
jgi:hypothetical protein